MAITRLGLRRSMACLVACLTALVLALAGCGGDDDGNGDAPGAGAGGGFADMQEVTLKVSTIYGPEQWQSTAIKQYTDAVTKRSEGKIKFEYFYGAALLGPDEQADGMKNGIADMAYFVPVYTAAKFPLDNWASTLGFVPDSSPVAGALQATASTIDWAFNTPEYGESFEKAGLKGLIPRIQVVHTYKLLCKEPIKTLADAKGKKVRIGGPAWAAEAKNLGMSPVTLTGEDIYPGFQRGLVDCYMGGYEDTRGLKLYEVGKEITTTALTGFTSYSLAMSLDRWNALPPVAQQALWDELPTYVGALTANSFDENRQLTEMKGMTFTAPGPEITQKVDAYHERLLSEAPGKAPKGVDGAKLTQSYQDIHDKWLKIVKDDLGFPADASDWAEQLEKDPKAADVDLQPWLDAIKTNVFDKHAPQPE